MVRFRRPKLKRRLGALRKLVVHKDDRIANKEEPKLKRVSDAFLLSDSDRLTYSYLEDESRNVSVISTVTYDILLDDKWVTAIYYDSVHEALHRHLVISADTPEDSVITHDGVKQRGSQRKWLNWAINDIKNDIKYNFLHYRREFLKRSRMLVDKRGSR